MFVSIYFFIATIVFSALTIPPLSAHLSKNSPDNAVKLEHLFCNFSGSSSRLPETDAPENRKFSTATLFQGLAHSCQQLGNVAGAQTQQEKQQATCNLVASVFQIAANVAAPSPQHQPPQPPQQNQSSQATKGDPFDPSLRTTTKTLTFALLKAMTYQEPTKFAYPRTTYLTVLNHLQTHEEQEALIDQLLTTQETAPYFLQELFSALHSYLKTELGLFLSTIYEALVSKTADSPRVLITHERGMHGTP